VTGALHVFYLHVFYSSTTPSSLAAVLSKVAVHVPEDGTSFFALDHWLYTGCTHGSYAQMVESYNLQLLPL